MVAYLVEFLFGVVKKFWKETLEITEQHCECN